MGHGLRIRTSTKNVESDVWNHEGGCQRAALFWFLAIHKPFKNQLGPVGLALAHEQHKTVAFSHRCRADNGPCASPWAQDALWVLSETPPSVGKIDLASFTYEEVATFEDVAYATDLEIRGEEAVVVLENRVVKIDLGHRPNLGRHRVARCPRGLHS